MTQLQLVAGNFLSPTIIVAPIADVTNTIIRSHYFASFFVIEVLLTTSVAEWLVHRVSSCRHLLDPGYDSRGFNVEYFYIISGLSLVTLVTLRLE